MTAGGEDRKVQRLAALIERAWLNLAAAKLSHIVACQKNVVLDFSRSDKRTDNACVESLNGKFRTEHLNAHWITNFDAARAKMKR